MLKVRPQGWSCGPDLEVDDANAVGDGGDGLQPVVSQQQVPQLGHFLIRVERSGSVSGHEQNMFHFS